MKLWILFIIFVFLFWEIRHFFKKDRTKDNKTPKTKKSQSETPIVQPKKRPKPTIDRSYRDVEDSTLNLSKKHSQFMFISPEAKREYMNSHLWINLKDRRLQLANYKCEACGSQKTPLHLHHETYIRLTVEEIDDVKILCSKCHNKIHRLLGYDRRTEYSISVLKK